MNWVWLVFFWNVKASQSYHLPREVLPCCPPSENLCIEGSSHQDGELFVLFNLSHWTTSSRWRTVWAITTNRKRHPMPTIVLLKWRSPTLKTLSNIENKKDCPKKEQRPLQNGNGFQIKCIWSSYRGQKFGKKDARASFEVLFLEVSD